MSCGQMTGKCNTRRAATGQVKKCLYGCKLHSSQVLSLDDFMQFVQYTNAYDTSIVKMQVSEWAQKVDVAELLA